MAETKRFICLAVLMICIFAAPAWSAGSEDVQGQVPLVVVKGSYNFVPGAWAEYWVKDKKLDKEYRLRFCSLEKTVYEDQKAAWIEVKVSPVGKSKAKGDPKVITKILTVDTPDGPGKVLEVIVQPQGFDPFIVPESFFADQGGDAADFQTIDPEAQAREITVRFKKKQIKMKAIEVKGKDKAGREVKAWVSEKVPPLGLIKAQTADMEMTIQNWGLHGSSQIKGEPMNFYIWIAAQVGKALSEAGDKSGK